MTNRKGATKTAVEIDEVARMRQKKQAAAARAQASSHAEYERRELADAHRTLDDLRRHPLSDRREAQADFLEALRDHPEIVSERIGWLLNGSYGYGPMQLAKRVLASPRMNRSAALTQMIGAYEWQCPEEMSRTAWKKLSATEQAALERSVQLAITSAEQAIEEAP